MYKPGTSHTIFHLEILVAPNEVGCVAAQIEGASTLMSMD